MSWAVVARKDFEDAARSKTLWVITALFVLATAGGMYALSTAFSNYTAADTIRFLNRPATLLVPLAALVVAYLSIAGERESGSIKLLLGLPHSRRDVLFGKLIGRSCVVAVATVIAFIAGAIVLLVQYGSFSITNFLVQGVATFIFGLVFVGIGVGFSAMTATRSRAMAGAIGLFAVFELLWSIVPLGIYYLVKGGLPTDNLPAWYFLIQILNPTRAYNIATQYLSDPNAVNQFAPALGGSVPFYLTGWFAIVILALWLVVPLGLGYWRFKGADIS
ncbi:ABC transporter [Haladaptatus sp. R4]|uniref:ABC transporter permease n=1 Tax=Haladaptatus sp. R4 TaxID=1679489 RepID=UPI0007B4F479|nr:ABC transporter permease [Haladaptatus sp. R4]KZN24470.1 ABC transporter [Haladaptatus sp. R4]